MNNRTSARKGSTHQLKFQARPLERAGPQATRQEHYHPLVLSGKRA